MIRIWRLDGPPEGAAVIPAYTELPESGFSTLHCTPRMKLGAAAADTRTVEIASPPATRSDLMLRTS
jgi:hypothetical protein